MSELINNREYRQKVLKELIMELHDGKSVEEVKGRFAKLIDGVSTQEITDMEQNLIAEGMPVEEIQRLCDVHASVFKGSIQDIHKVTKFEEVSGHPIHTFKLENRAIEDHMEGNIRPKLKQYEKTPPEHVIKELLEDLSRLREIDKHYSRKENLLFPFLEKAGITAPPQVMWGVDDEIRDALKELEFCLKSLGPWKDFVKKLNDTLTRIEEMIFKEEKILFPMALDTLTEDEWHKIAQESDEIGYCFVIPDQKWIPERSMDKKKIMSKVGQNALNFQTGVLEFGQVEALINHLPIDITFIDKDDVVKFFSQGKERIFPRTKTVIGRNVSNCHPPASVHIVESILEDFKTGRKDTEDFWLKMGDMYIYIRYFAVRNESGEYIGTMEITQNIAPIQEISGEKRLLSDE